MPARERTDQHAGDGTHDQRPDAEQRRRFGHQIHGHPCAIDHQADRGGGLYKCVLLRVEGEQGGRTDTTLVPDQPAEQSGDRSGQPCRRSPEPHVSHQPGKLREADEPEKTAEHDPERSIRGKVVEQRAGKSADGAGQTERHEDAAIEMTAKEPQARRRSDYVGIETAATASRVPTRIARIGVRMLPMPKPATDARAPARIAAAVTSRSNGIAQAYQREQWSVAGRSVLVDTSGQGMQSPDAANEDRIERHDHKDVDVPRVTAAGDRAAARQGGDSTAPAVVFDHVSFAFDDHVVLRDVSFAVPKGTMKILLGASGAGKSIILKLAIGLLRPDSGTILVNGQRIEQMTEGDLMHVRSDIGMLFQEGALFDSLTVAENVGYRLYEETDTPMADVRHRVEEVLGFVGLSDYIDQMPSELSGGQRRRVAIARAMAARPSLLLFDDPTTGLDPITATTVDDRDRQAARPGAGDVNRRDASDPRCVLRRDARGGSNREPAGDPGDPGRARRPRAVHGASRGPDLFRGQRRRAAGGERRLLAGVPVHDAAAVVASAFFTRARRVCAVNGL